MLTRSRISFEKRSAVGEKFAASKRVVISALFEPASRRLRHFARRSLRPACRASPASTMGPPVKRQATLHQLGKVQTSRSSSYYNVSLEDIARHKKTLEDKATTKSDFVASLRQLSSMLLTKDLLEQSMIGLCVNRIAKKHPDGDMRVLARNIVEKWREEVRGQVKRDAKRLRTVAGWRKPNR